MLRSELFNLVLLDILMPEVDGFQVLREMKDDTVLRDVPVIVISALEEMDSVVRCIEMGAEDHLPKNFDPVLLNARIGASLEKKAAAGRGRRAAQVHPRDLRQIRPGKRCQADRREQGGARAPAAEGDDNVHRY